MKELIEKINAGFEAFKNDADLQNEKGNNIKVVGFDASLSGDNSYETFTQAMTLN